MVWCYRFVAHVSPKEISASDVFSKIDMKASLKIWTFVVLILCFVAVYLGMLIVGKSEFRAHVAFLNIGQGDAILISFGSNQLLIDTGKSGRALLSELGRQLPPWDRTIEVVLLTHPDQDHVGAFPDLVSRYTVGMLLSAELPETTAIGRAIRQTIDSHSIQRIEPRVGLSIDFAPDMHLETLFPGVNFVPNPKNTNASTSSNCCISVATLFFLRAIYRKRSLCFRQSTSMCSKWRIMARNIRRATSFSIE